MKWTAVAWGCLSIVAAVANTADGAVAPVEAPKPADRVLLAYRLQPGETLQYRKENQSTLMAIKGQTREKTYSKSVTEQRIEVISSEDGVTTLELSIAGVTLEYAFNDAEPTVQSSRDKNLPAGLDAFVGRPLAEVRLRADGTTESIKPLLAGGKQTVVPGKLGVDEAAALLFVKLPASPVAVGDEWHEMQSVRVAVTRNASQEVKILKQYRLESNKDGVAEISLKHSLITPVTEPSMRIQLIQRTSEGTIRFDVAAGRILDQTTSVDNTEIGFSGPDSSLHAVSRNGLRLVADPNAVSSR